MDLAADRRNLTAEGVALCLSGGGYRAMLFHVGALWRLNEFSYLPRLDRISSVSGGSITAGILGMNWHRLVFDPLGVATNFGELVVKPARQLAAKTLDVWAASKALLLPLGAADCVARAYKRHIFGDASLKDLPADRPRVVINATNIRTGVLFRFSRPYLADYRIGQLPQPNVPLAVAVAASSAFPPFLSPLHLSLDASLWASPSGAPSEDCHREPYLSSAVLTDGGVYDNLGLETAWKRYRTVLISDGGAPYPLQPRPRRNWLGQLVRVLNTMDRQVRSLRKREIFAAFNAHERDGTYWGISTNIADYGLANALPCPIEETSRLAALSTRLKHLDPATQDRLINWGYAVCDAAMRRWVDRSLQEPAGFPYAASGINASR